MSGDSQSTVPRALWAALIAVAALSLVAEFFVHHHAYFGIDGSFGFYAWYTVGIGVIGIALARVLALVLGRSGDDHA